MDVGRNRAAATRGGQTEGQRPGDVPRPETRRFRALAARRCVRARACARMCVCVCAVCMCVRVCAMTTEGQESRSTTSPHTHTQTSARADTQTHAQTYTGMRTQTDTHTDIRPNTYTDTHRYTQTHAHAGTRTHSRTRHSTEPASLGPATSAVGASSALAPSLLQGDEESPQQTPRQSPCQLRGRPGANTEQAPAWSARGTERGEEADAGTHR